MSIRNTMRKRPKICTCCRVSEAKIYLYHSSKIAKAGPGSDDRPDHPLSRQILVVLVQTQTSDFIYDFILHNFVIFFSLCNLQKVSVFANFTVYYSMPA